MRIFSMILLCLVAQVALAGADYQREKKWADEVVSGIVTGDPVYLELNNGHKFLAIFTEEMKARVGVIVVHGLGVHPDWNMIGTLRTQLAEHGYTTLSIQMPVLSNEAQAGAYDALFPEAEARIQLAADFLRGKGYKKIAIVSHSMGSAMSLNYVKNNQSGLLAWVSAGLGHNYTYSGIHIPVLDLYGEYDLPPVMSMAKKRAKSLKGTARSSQVMVPKSDHFMNNHEAEMMQAVTKFLDSLM
jgi:alpha/beta superfamily hydrolase